MRYLSYNIGVILFIGLISGMVNCGKAQNKKVDLPKPYATPSVRVNSKVIGWPEGKIPVAPAGFKVEAFARNFSTPRWIYVSPAGDIFVSDDASQIFRHITA